MEGTYFKELPKDITNIIDEYQKEYVKKILQSILNTPAAIKYYTDNMPRAPDTIMGIKNELAKDGIVAEFEKENGKWVLNIKDVAILSDKELFDVLNGLRQSIATVPSINTALKTNNANFKFVPYDNKIEMEYLK